MLRSVASNGDVVALQAPDRLDLFPTPVTFWRWDEADTQDPEIAMAVRCRRRTTPAHSIADRYNWDSAHDLTQWPEDAIQALVRWVAACAQAATLGWRVGIGPSTLGAWRVSGWANVSLPNAFATLRHYARDNWHWSAIYCVDQATSITFEERGVGIDVAGTASRRSRRIIIQPGQLVIFPAWLAHRVEPHFTNNDRTILVFNLHNPALEASRLWERPANWTWRSFPSFMRRLASWCGRPDWSPAAPPLGTDILP